MQLISDKFSVPLQPTPHIVREKLLKVLKASMKNHPSTLIVGRTGTGKSALVADFIRKCDCRVAWLKTEASDSEWPLFLKYLIESVKKQRPEFNNEKVLQVIETNTDPFKAAEVFINELVESGSKPLLVVIDDLHYIYDAEWTTPFFNRLLPFLPFEVHFILIGRSMPPAPLWRMRSKQTLNVIDEKMLTLMPEEAMRLFLDYGISEKKAFMVSQNIYGRIGIINLIANHYLDKNVLITSV